MVNKNSTKIGSIAIKIAFGVLAILSVLFVSFVVWGSTPAQPMPEAAAALQSTGEVEVKTGDWLVFQPAGMQPDTGLILYPGGRVDYRAYAPLARAIAGKGYLVVIVPMPLNLAVFGSNRAGEVIDAYPRVVRWVVGGHSLGGAMAANYAAQNLERIDGLVLLASYPAESDSLAGSHLPVISISATLDGLANPEKIDASRALLPAGTRFVIIEGGNHAQFGWYGMQNGDGSATISRADQQDQTIEAVTGFLAGVESE